MTLALLMLAGGGQPAVTVAAPVSVFNNGGPNLSPGHELTAFVQAEDFTPSNNVALTGARFWTLERTDASSLRRANSPPWDGTLDYFLYLNESFRPTTMPFASGAAVNIRRSATGVETAEFREYEYTFDLAASVPLQAGTNYWIGLHLSTNWNTDEIYWERTDSGFGFVSVRSQGSPLGPWTVNIVDRHLAFDLTGIPIAPCLLSITQQPADVTADAGEMISFTTAATPLTTTFVFQWQTRLDSNDFTDFTDIPGATNSTYSKVAALADNGAQFRCLVGNGCTNVASAAATLTVRAPVLSVAGMNTLAEPNAGFANALLTVALSFTSRAPVTVTAFTSNGTAVAGFDYLAVSNTLTIPPGSLTALFAVPVLGDTNVENNETFFIHLRDPVNATFQNAGPFSVLIVDAPPFPDCNRNGIDDAQDIGSGTSFDTDHNGVPDECQAVLSLAQASFIDARGNFVRRHSDYALLRVRAVQPPDEGVAWLNVQRAGAWVVQNLPLLARTCEGDLHDYNVSFNLGNTSGVPVTTASLAWSISTQPLASAPQTFTANLSVTEDLVYPSTSARTAADPSSPFTPPPAQNFSYLPGAGPMMHVTRRGVPAVSEETNHCGPGAGARCLEWMNKEYCLGLTNNAQSIYDVLKDMSHMMTTDTNGTYYNKIADALNKYLGDHAPRSGAMAADCQAGSPADLVDALKQGKDVIMLMGYYDENGNRTGGHIVVATGATMDKDGNTVIDFQDDCYGGDDQGDGKADGGGTKSADVADDGAGGHDLSGFGAEAKFEGFIKVCPPPQIMASYILKTLLGAVTEPIEGVGPRLARFESGADLSAAELAELKSWACMDRDNAGFLLHTLLHESAPPSLVFSADELRDRARQLAALMNQFVRRPDPVLLPPMRQLVSLMATQATDMLPCLGDPRFCTPPPPVLTAARPAGGNGLVVAWPAPGVLQAADAITGPWRDLPAAVSPHTNAPVGRAQFFRVAVNQKQGCIYRVKSILSGECPVGRLLCVTPCPSGGCPTPPFDPATSTHYLSVVDDNGGEVCRIEVSPTTQCGPCDADATEFRWVDAAAGTIKAP